MKLKIASLLFVACVPTLCAAQQQRPGHASEWVRLSGAQVRLVALPVDPSGPDAWQSAGVEIRLEPGVKTYWRAPGDTGVPPTIDFSPSQGVRELTLDFPAPVGFDDGAGGMAIGYRETQIFPVRFKLEKPAEPTSTGGGFFSRKVEAPPPPVPPKLEMNIEFGICTKNMCVPAQAKAALPLGGGTLEAALGDRIAAANARVPVRQKVGAPGAVGISSVHVRRKAGMAEIEVAARVGNDTGTAGLFIEAKETLVAKRTDAPIGGSVVFRAKTADPADGKLGEARITLATDKGAVDVLVDLDAAARRP
ncbi:MAG TPA: protein-disulfide reductase DsbD family protein [Beijerinckiaceae bacterium]|nr:protein-disulfide reductase DsbD family protein [Beijerinckiaceae bacterium]